MIKDPFVAEGNVTTRDGAPVMLFAYFSPQQRSYTGVFYNRDSWIACSWNKDGTYIDKKTLSGMDLIVIPNLLKIVKDAA